MSMHNPPHPGLVLREYLGRMAVSAAAAHLRVTRVTLSRVQRQGRNLGEHGPSPCVSPWNFSGTLDEHAEPVRFLAG